MISIIERIEKYSILFYVGGSSYLTVEMFYRGYSYRTMFFAGAIAFLLIGGINNWLPWKMPFLLQAVIGAVLVTTVELIFGLIFNVWLGYAFWDYSHLPLNLFGQICALYGLLWVPLSALGIVLDDYLRWLLWRDEKPRYKLF